MYYSFSFFFNIISYGFEVIDNRELDEIKKIFDSGGILFKNGLIILGKIVSR